MTSERFEGLSFTPDHDAGRAALEAALEGASPAVAGLARAAYEAGAAAAEAPARPARMLALDMEAEITPRGGRIGGPAWRQEGAGWPELDGAPMLMIAQLDLAGLALEGLPQAGLLQVFINRDICILDTRCVVEWHPDPQGARILPQPPGAQGPFPEEEECARGFAIVPGPSGAMRPTVDDAAVQDALRGATAAADPVAGGQARDLALDALAGALNPAWAHHAGGHMVSTQGEVTLFGGGRDAPGIPLDRCILRLGWDEETIMWGDAGEAALVIPAADLAARDFSRAEFTWDGC
ncbi:DUF1963 domain-containing protein [Rhodovulum sp. DZ06]|uniref:DUF1963 domain-containing protein n=1 Tax=Rhodovulum sp. DZ06 TaxID=3425126 RepID=UPI003D34FF3A